MRDYDNRNLDDVVQYLEARIAAMAARIRELEDYIAILETPEVQAAQSAAAELDRVC